MMLIWLLVAGAVGEAGATAQLCDSSVHPLRNSELSYRLRGDRCEGLYAADVASTSLLVASLTLGEPAFDPRTAATIRLSWPAVSPNRPTHLRAVTLSPETYYRMDAQVPGSRTWYDWSPDVLAALKLGPDAVGLVASDAAARSSGERELLLPLTVGSRPPGAASPLVIRVIPGVTLKALSVAFVPGVDGARGGTVRAPGSVFAAEGVVRIELPRTLQPGLYRVTVRATTRDGTPLTEEFRTMVPPSPVHRP